MLRRQRLDGPSVQVPGNDGEGATITLHSESWSLDWPGGGLVWNRPTSAVVERDGQADRIAIVDWTRVIQVGLVLFATGSLVAACLQPRAKRRNNDD